MAAQHDSAQVAGLCLPSKPAAYLGSSGRDRRPGAPSSNRRRPRQSIGWHRRSPGSVLQPGSTGGGAGAATGSPAGEHRVVRRHPKAEAARPAQPGPVQEPCRRDIPMLRTTVRLSVKAEPLPLRHLDRVRIRTRQRGPRSRADAQPVAPGKAGGPTRLRKPPCRNAGTKRPTVHPVVGRNLPVDSDRQHGTPRCQGTARPGSLGTACAGTGDADASSGATGRRPGGLVAAARYAYALGLVPATAC